MATTAAAIRDRVKALIEAIAPAVDTQVRFRSYRNEGAGGFVQWSEEHAPACLRRFQARTSAAVNPIDQGDFSADYRWLDVVVTVAYPQTGRWGEDGALDRDDCMDVDFGSIDAAIGVTNAANFSATGAIPTGCSKRIERGANCDFLIVTESIRYSWAL